MARIVREKKVKGPQKGSPRVEAWIHTVINPLLESISVELSLLERGNVTWRFDSEKLAFIRPLNEYIAPPSRPNYEDFVRANRAIARFLQQHDALVMTLEQNAQVASRSLLRSQEFLYGVEQSLTAYLTRPGQQAYPGGGVPEEQFPALMAEHVVNNVQELPRHYTDSDFWKQYGATLRAFARGPEFEALRQSRDTLFKHDQLLKTKLLDLRFDLCGKYDVPAAPTSPSGE